MTDLKSAALLERIGEMVIQYEDRVANLRVELTNVVTELEALKKESTDKEPVESVAP